MKLTRQKKVSIEKTLRAAEKAGDLLDAKLLLLEAKYNSKVEALQIGDEVDEEGICDAALWYLGERERLMREAKEMMELKKGKMKVVVAVILYLLQLVGVKRSDHFMYKAYFHTHTAPSSYALSVEALLTFYANP